MHADFGICHMDIASVLLYRLDPQMETMKKSYHSACKEEKLAASRETNSKLESNNNPDAQKKLQEKVEKCQQEVQKVGLPLGKDQGCKVVLS